MKKTDIETLLLATPMQESMVFASLAQPNSGHYVLQLTFELHGRQQPSQIDAAWQTLLRRHVALRTRFVWKRQEKLRQLVRKSINSKPEWLDLSAIPAAQQDEKCQSFLEQDKRRGFALESAPLTRLSVLELSAEKMCCVWAFHHSIVDGWSIAILFRELCTIYAALSKGVPEPVAAVALENLVDHIHNSSAAAWNFWRQQLSGEQNRYPLAAVEAPRSAEPGHCISEFRLDAAASEQIYAACRARRITFASLALAGWSLLLSYYSGRDAVLFGTISSGRGSLHDGGVHSVGLHISLQPVRVAVDMHTGVDSFLVEFQRLNVLCGEHEHLAPAALAELLQIEPGTPLFDSMLVVENHPGSEQLTAEMHTIGVRNVQGYEQSDTPLAVSLGSDDCIVAVSRFHAQRFSEDRIAFLMNFYFDLLARLASASDRQTLNDLLPSLSTPPAELSAAGFSPGQQTPSRFVELFTQQVRQSPNKAALYYQNQTISYASLADHAEAIRQTLLAHGAASGDIVAVNMQRSPACIAAMLAILALDACYLPLDPSYPQQRLGFMLRDSGSKLMLCADDSTSRERSAVAVTVPQAGNSESPSRLQLAAAFSNSSMCLIYTSGSTGQPKGVMLRHDSMLNRCRWQWQQFPFEATDVCCHRTPLGFVDSVCEIFSPLCGGVPNAVISNEELSDLNGFIDILDQRQISRVTFVPGLLAAVLEILQAAARSLPSLTLCCSSGEPLPAALAEKFLSLLPGCKLLNIYGSTEVAADALYYEIPVHEIPVHEIPVHELPAQAIVPIGKPISGVHASVVNARHQPLPAGVLGELCIGGVAVADGYHQCSAESAVKFIRQPGSIDFFLSGDLAIEGDRQLFHYRGRSDRQLKVRGQRVEPGEIESILCDADAITNAAAVQLADGRLVAGFVAKHDMTVERSDLMTKLQHALPAFALPQALLQLDEMPLNASGKVDFSALQALFASQSPPQHAVAQAPVPMRQQAVFTIIKNIWQELLPHAQVRAGDNFFQLGGQSLLAMRMIARAERSLHVEIPLPLLMEGPSLADFAAAVSAGKHWSNDNELLTLKAAKAKPGLFCVHGDAFNLTPHLRGECALHWLSQWPRRMSLTRHQPQLPPLETIEQIATNYLQQVRKTQAVGPYYFLAGSAAGIIVYEMAQQLLARVGEPATLLLMDLPQGELQAGSPANQALHTQLGQRMRTAYRRFGPPARERQLNYRRAQRKLQRGLSLTDREARDFTNGQLFAAVTRYQIKPYPGRVIYIVSRYWAKRATPGEILTPPQHWQHLLPNIDSVQIAPALVHNDLLQGDSAKFVAELCAATIDSCKQASPGA